MPSTEPGHGVAFARAALAGNPSDRYGGAVLAVTLPEWRAQAQVRRRSALNVEPPSALARATVRRFAREFAPGAIGSDVRWSTSIPRGVGLGGSSALVIATLRALGDSYGVRLRPSELAGCALAVEVEDLGIEAGLQDRVVQAYGGLMFMDFDPAYTAADGHGRYERLDSSLLPALLLAWREDAAGDSGLTHSSLRDRFEQGEPGVGAALAELGVLARDARTSLASADLDEFARCVDASFDARRRMMSLDGRHVEMIERARAAGASANYTGSGGAIVAVCSGEGHRDEVSEALVKAGCRTAFPVL